MTGRMKAVQGAVAALVLMVGATLAWRARSGSAAEPPAKPQAAILTPAPAAGPSLATAGAPAGSLALQWMSVLEKSLQSPATPAQQELLRSQERELSDEMKKRLAEDPARWADLLEVLSKEDPRIGRKIIVSLKDGVGQPAEAVLIRSLKEGSHRESRLSAATLIGPRRSNDCFWAIVTAAQEDPDSGVRFKALQELAARKAAPSSPAETTTIDDVLRQRARLDADPVVRRFALQATGQPPEPGTASAPPPPRSSFSSGFKTR